jgi:hypothetical protein
MSNAVEATYPDGTKQLIFKTAEPGFETEDAMRKLFEWYNSDTETLQIIKDALFVYDFLSIHPFQDGNGRLSRLLGTLLLMRHGYTWIQYVSFEHEIENRKAEYYKILMQTQRQRPGEKVDEWVLFFLDCMINIQGQLMEKLKTKNSNIYLGAKEKNILSFIESHPGCRSGEISKKLGIPLPTVKKIITGMVDTRVIIKSGAGAGTNYHIETTSPVKTDLVFKLTNQETRKAFTLRNQENQIQIKKIVLVPLFEWTTPDHWTAKLLTQGINFRIRGITTKGTFESMYSLISFNNPFLFQPIFNLANPINLPMSIVDRKPNHGEYPIRIVVELESSVSKIDFDILFIYDEESA